MVEIRARSYEDAEYDNCSRTAIAVLSVGSVTIPLCSECIEALSDSLREFNETVFCHKCVHYEPSRWGWRYDGKCKKTGYDAAPMDTCGDNERKGGEGDGS